MSLRTLSASTHGSLPAPSCSTWGAHLGMLHLGMVLLLVRLLLLPVPLGRAAAHTQQALLGRPAGKHLGMAAALLLLLLG